MKKYVLACILFICESIVLFEISTFFEFNTNYSVKIVIVYLLFMLVFEHYTITSKLIWDEMRMLFKANICVFVTAVLLSPTKLQLHRLWDLLIIGLCMYFFALILNRTFRILLRKSIARKTLIIGVGNEAEYIGRVANNNRFALTVVKGYVKCENESVNERLRQGRGKNRKEKVNRIYQLADISNVLERENIEQVIVAVSKECKQDINEILQLLYNKVSIIKYVPNIDVLFTFNSRIQDFDGVLLVSTAQGKLGVKAKVFKRIIDIIASLMGIILLIPIFFYVRHKNHKANDYNPIIFTQNRIGLDGKPIKIYKFRTMIPNAEEILEELMEKNPEIRDEYQKNKKLKNDPRITEVGKFLRKSSLDEFPQFLNVFKGEMSLVGPRPYLFREKEDMGVYYESVIRCKPGITGMWQANGRSDIGFEDRCKLDDYYYKNWTIGLDMIIIYKTIKSVIYGKGAV